MNNSVFNKHPILLSQVLFAICMRVGHKTESQWNQHKKEAQFPKVVNKKSVGHE